jgi:O-antigen/teichoic acid export membrane protein
MERVGPDPISSLSTLGQLARQLSGLAVGQVAAALAAFTLNVLIAKTLGPTGYGQYAIFLAVAAVAFMPFTWLFSAVVVFGQEDMLRHGTALRAATAISVVIATETVLALPVYAAMIGIASAAFAFLAELWPFVALSIVFNLMFGVTLGALQARRRFGAYAVFVAASALVPLVLTAISLGIAPDLPHAVGGTVVGQVLALSPLAVRMLRDLRAPEVDRAMVRATAAYAGSYVPGTLQAYVLGQADVILVGLVLDPVSVGIYGLAARLYRQLLVFADQLATISLPVVNELRVGGQPGRIVAFLDRRAPQAMVYLILASALAAALGGVIIPVVFGAAFAPASSVFVVLAGALAVGCWRRLVSPVLTAHRMILQPTVAGTVAALLFLGLAAILARPLGATGVAASVLAAALVELAIVLWYAHRRLGGRTSARSVVLLAFGVGMTALPLAGAPVGLALLLAALVAYPFIVRALRVLGVSEVDRLAAASQTGPGRRMLRAALMVFAARDGREAAAG